MGDVLEHRRLAGLGRADNERTLPLPERVHEVDHPLGEIPGGGLKVEQLVRMNRGQIAKMRSLAGRLRVHPGDELNPDDPVEALSLTRETEDATNRVPLAQGEPADEGGWHVDVVGSAGDSAPTKEAVPL